MACDFNKDGCDYCKREDRFILGCSGCGCLFVSVVFVIGVFIGALFA